MNVRKLSSSGDYSFGQNKKDYVGGAEATAQAIKTKILLFYGEWWEDIGLGIPMFQSIVGQTDPATIQNSLSMLLQKRIAEVSSVKTIDSINVQLNKRQITVIIDVTDKNNESTSVEVSI